MISGEFRKRSVAPAWNNEHTQLRRVLYGVCARVRFAIRVYKRRRRRRCCFVNASREKRPKTADMLPYMDGIHLPAWQIRCAGVRCFLRGIRGRPAPLLRFYCKCVLCSLRPRRDVKILLLLCLSVQKRTRDTAHTRSVELK